MGVVKSKKRRILTIALVVLSVCIVICATVYYIVSRTLSFDNSEILVFDDSGVLAEYESHLNGWYLAGGADLAYGIRIIINNDGTAEIINTPEVIRENKEIPSFSFAVSASDVAGLQDEIRATGFLALEKDVSTDSYDGSLSFITVHTQTKVHKSGGLNPNNEQFSKVKDYILSMVPEDVMQEYKAAVELYYSD